MIPRMAARCTTPAAAMHHFSGSNAPSQRWRCTIICGQAALFERRMQWYTHDKYIEVSEEVADELRASRLYEAAYQRRLIRNKAQYSLDCEDGIEYSACVSEPTPQELLERMELFCNLCVALNSLPETQGRRVDACVILGKSYGEVVEAEGVNKSSVRESVKLGLESMKKYLKKVL